jgi:hypothetical protein
MVREAVTAGVKRIIVTHPLLDIVDMHDDQIKEVVSMGPNVYAEFTSQFGNPGAPAANVMRHVSGIRARASNGRSCRATPARQERRFNPMRWPTPRVRCGAQGFTERELDLLFKINPAAILGIPPPAN